MVGLAGNPTGDQTDIVVGEKKGRTAAPRSALEVIIVALHLDPVDRMVQ